MLDQDDSGDWLTLALFGGWKWALFCLLVAGVVAFIASQNAADCEARACPAGTAPRLLDGECVCTAAPGAPERRRAE